MRNPLASKAQFMFCSALIIFFLVALGRSGTGPELEQILRGVQDRVREFESLLPDFMCQEEITTQELLRGGLADRNVTQSIFTGTQNKDEKGHSFTESRELKRVNGRPAAKGEQLKLPFFFGGGFSSILDATFGEKNIQYHNYKVLPSEQVEGKAAWVIQFSTKPDQKGLFFEFQGSRFISKDAGKAWIDPESLHVLQLERRYLNLPPVYGVMTIVINYAPVVLNGKTFWMPKTVQVDEVFDKLKDSMSMHYFAEYSDYQKFDVSVRIKY